MTLCCFSNSKSLIHRHNFYIRFTFKITLVYFSSVATAAAQKRPSSDLRRKVFMSKGNFFSIQEIVNGINKKIQSCSNGLSKNLILRTAKDYSPFQDYCLNSLVIDSDLLTTVINYISHEPRIVLRVFKWAEGQDGFRHSEVLFCSVLDSLVQNGFMDAAFRVVEKAVILEMHSVTDVLIDGYLKHRVSCQILDLLLRIYVKRCNVDRCLDVFHKMLSNGLLPDVKNCNRILRLLRDRNLVGKVKEVYALMGQFGIRPTIVTYNIILDLYFKECDVQQEFAHLHETLGNDCWQNDVTINVMVNELLKRGQFEQAKELIMDMLKKGVKVSAYSYNSLISRYCRKGLLDSALRLVKELEMTGALPTVSTYNTFMHEYCKQGRVDYAKQWIALMVKKNLVLDIISYNVLIHGYCLLGDMREALLLLCDMKKRNLNPSVVTYNTIVDWFSRTGDLERARNLKDEMTVQGILPDVYTYTILVRGSYRAGNAMMAKDFYEEMLRNGLEPDRVAYTNFIVGEFKLGDLPSANKLQEEMLCNGYKRDIVTYNVLVEGNSSLGNLEEALQLLRKMEMAEDGFMPDHFTYTSVIHAYLKMGDLKIGRKLFHEMLSKGVSPTVVTYTILIHAHARKGLLEPAFKYFLEMQNMGIIPNVITYNALINGLCKFKTMDEAYRFFSQMPCKPNKYTYTILISRNSDLKNWQEVLRLYKEMIDKGIQPDSYTHSALFRNLRRDYISLAARDLERVISDDRDTV